MDLTVIWFLLIAVLWTGFFVLEGFDFGVGVLLRGLARDETERSMMVNAIGPVWDGNEVWLLTAGGATFAAFPEWYATMFSAFYLPLFLILLALIVRGVAFEFRHQGDAAWRGRWDTATTVASVTAPLLLGVAVGGLVHGIVIEDRVFVGGLLDLVSPYALVAGVGVLLLSVWHGAGYVALKVEEEYGAPGHDPLADRARRLAAVLGPVVTIALVAFLAWTLAAAGDHLDAGVVGAAVLTVAAAGTAVVAGRRGRDGLAFSATAGTFAFLVATLFLDLFPRVMVSTLGPAEDLTIANSASTDYTLTLMTWAAVVFVPIVVGYQAWTYWVFRERVRADRVTGAHTTPLDALAERRVDGDGPAPA
jgi:cytochrome d ubiquinol oxidase subunit II